MKIFLRGTRICNGLPLDILLRKWIGGFRVVGLNRILSASGDELIVLPLEELQEIFILSTQSLKDTF